MTLSTCHFFFFSNKLQRCDRRELEEGKTRFFNSNPQTIHHRDNTRTIETKRRHLLERRDNALEAVQELEEKLGILENGRWDPSSAEWTAAGEKVRLRKYRRALDILEGLVVARIFELSKMNLSETGMLSVTLRLTILITGELLGYKLRVHIANALKARSHSIKKALDNYNSAAATLKPRAPQLTWEDVVDYAFLADFDLLRDARQDVRDKPWATPANRLLRDQFFKMERAREEIRRLNIEIRRVITYIHDELIVLERQENAVKDKDLRLAHQIHLYKMECARASSLHMDRFQKLAAHPGFTGDLSPGCSIQGITQQLLVMQMTPRHPVPASESDSGDSGEEGDVEDIAFKVLSISDMDDGVGLDDEGMPSI